MATEMIKGAEYTFGGERFTFAELTRNDPKWGVFVHTSGHRYTLRLCDVEPVAEPTPFPEPERWVLSTCERIVFCDRFKNVVEKTSDGKTLTKHHNAEVDRLMREIRRLEALVNKK